VPPTTFAPSPWVGGAWLPPNLERSATTIAHAGSCTGREELPCVAPRLWAAASSEPPHPSPIGNTAIKQMETGHYHCHNIKGRRAKDLQQKCIETRIKIVIRFFDRCDSQLLSSGFGSRMICPLISLSGFGRAFHTFFWPTLVLKTNLLG